MYHRLALISISVTLSQTPAEAASPRACSAPSLNWYQFILLGEQRHMCVNNLPRVVPTGCKSNTLTTVQDIPDVEQFG